ncbi:PROTEIN (SEIPIN) putative-RELATED [Salix purpurea]|uniref:PROTEIN (SEIPIN) putative-RELATED n=1 Tax=Salix purpurea TaxID=77065 RepID=A0A9Q0WMI0_SALPP|nr:PROTEIN (SEIPIN) putative-RELATED [Salix purpurea]
MDGAEPTRSILDRVEQRRVDYSAVGGVGEEEKEESTVTTANEDRVGDSIDSAGELNESTNLLEFVAGLVIKAIGFQLNLFFYFITCPFWILYCFYMLVVDPFGAIRRGRGFIARKLVSLWNFVGGFFGSYIDDWLKEHKTILSLLMQFGWGLFWSCYVCVILCGLLVFAVMLSGLLMRYLVEEPIQIRQDFEF